MAREYQYGFAGRDEAMYDRKQRELKARTMLAVLRDHYDGKITGLQCLTIGGSTGIIDNFLAGYLGHVTSVDIDAPAIAYAKATFDRKNLDFLVGDAMNIPLQSEQFDVVVCSQVYEHVPDSRRMMEEIFRILRPGGVCYFAANNRFMFDEPHYNLPLLSVLPRRLAHLYIRLSGKAHFYYERHLSYWGLKRLVAHFNIYDYTRMIIADPHKYAADYMLAPGSRKAAIARLISQYIYWLVPGYVWLLKKPKH